MDSDQVKEILGNILIAVPVTIIVFFGISNFLTEYWIKFGSIVIGYLVSDYSIKVVVNAEKGAGTIPIFGHLFQPKGLVYLFYVVGILISTYAGSIVEKIVISNGNTITNLNLLAINIVLSVAIWLHFEKRYYNNSPFEAASNSID